MEYNTELTTVESLVRAIAEEKFEPNGVDYIFANWAQANVELDHLEGPTIMYVLPASGTLDVNNRRQRIYDAPQTMLAFMAPTDFDFEGNANDEIIENMKRLAIAFIVAINASGLFEEIEGDLEYQVIYDHLDENVTGVMITPTLKEKQGIALCDNLRADGSSVLTSLFGTATTGR